MTLERIGPFEYQRFAPTQPGREHRPVLIAGGGPVGLTLALGLARRGIRSLVIEADDSVCEGSRAACISRRSLEITERLGVAGALLGKGLPWARGRSYYGTDEVLMFEMPSSPGEKFPPMINLEQYYIEQFLLDAIGAVNQAQPGMVEIAWATRVTKFSQHAAGVSVRAENALGRFDLTGDWLLATDGGQSFIRSTLGLELKGTGYQGRYAIVDIELASDHPTERRAWFDPPWARGTTILMHRQPDDIWRIDYQLAQGQDADKVLQPDEIKTFVQTHLDAIGEGHLAWKPVWTSIYRAGAMTLDSYRQGRILFAGNSAHAMPIFGVRGLNSGFDDADNLLWKLAAVIRGKAGDALLDTYSAERIQAFHVNASYAMRSTEFMSPPHRGFELLREAVLSLAKKHTGIARLVNPRQTHAITYEDSPLSSPHAAFEGGPRAGEPLWDLPLPGGGHLIDRLAQDGFTLLALDRLESGAALGAVQDASEWKTLPCRIDVLVGANAAAVALRYGVPAHARMGAAWLLRPDGHVCGHWIDPSAAALRAAIEQASCMERTPS